MKTELVTEDTFLKRNGSYVKQVVEKSDVEITVVAVHRKKQGNFIGLYGGNLFFFTSATSFTAYHQPNDDEKMYISFEGQCLNGYGPDYVAIKTVGKEM